MVREISTVATDRQSGEEVELLEQIRVDRESGRERRSAH